MNVQMWWGGSIDSVEEFPKLDGTVSALTCPQNLACLHVKGSKEGCCAVPRVVMGAALHLSRAHGQQRLHAVKRLDLGLLVHTQDQSPIGRVHVQSHNIPDLLDEQRVSGELEALGTMGLQSKSPPNTTHSALTQSGSSSQRSSAPMGGVPRHGLQSQRHGSFHISIGDLPRSTRTRFVQQAVQPLRQKPSAPLPDSMRANPHLGSNHAITFPGSAAHYQATSLSQGLASLGPPNPVFQGLALLRRQREWRNGTSGTHNPSQQFYPSIPEGLTFVKHL